MARRKLYSYGQISSAILDERFQCVCAGIDYLSVFCFSDGGAWNGSLVVTPEVSLDGSMWTPAAYIDDTDGSATAVTTFTANGWRMRIPVFHVPFFQIRVSTIGGATTIKAFVYGEGEWDPLNPGNAADPVFGNPGVSLAGGQRPGGGTLTGGGGFSGATFPGGAIS